MVKIIETPRDAFQSITHFIPAEKKIGYINALLKAGFDTVEAGSFVSAKAIPQLQDTAAVIKGLDMKSSRSRIMVLAANRKGVETALAYDEIQDISYPFSASPVFLQKNIGKSQVESLLEIEQCISLCEKRKKRMVVYITMAFGNPYGDEWSAGKIADWAETLVQLGVQCIPLSDITGEADEQKITEVFTTLNSEFPDIEFGLHLHSEPSSALQKVNAAWKAGCRRFDTVIGGLGGCPMTGKEMLGNLDTRVLVDILSRKGIQTGIKIPSISL
jgi:hydroxymethylglutaryl-CoA lyase